MKDCKSKTHRVETRRVVFAFEMPQDAVVRRLSVGPIRYLLCRPVT